MNLFDRLVDRRVKDNVITGIITGINDAGKYSVLIDGTTKWIYGGDYLIGDVVTVLLVGGDLNKAEIVGKSSRIKNTTPRVVVR